MASAAIACPAKSAEAFRTISEVAIELDVPQHVLRFWESRFTQVRPVKRAGGRRYYRPEDVDLLRGIRALLYGDGFTIRGVQKVLRDRGHRHVAQIGRGASFHLRPVPMPEMEDTGSGEIEETGMEEIATNIPPVRILQQEIAAAHAAPVLSEHARLEALLAELLEMKARLRGAASGRAS